MIAAAIILFLAVLAWDVISDYQKWLKGRGVIHGKEAWIRCIMLIPAIVLFIVGHPGNISWHVAYSSALMCFFVFWTSFDGLYNVLRGFNWWYTGSNDKDDAKTDNFLQSIPKWLHILIKLGGVAGGIYLYLK